MAGVEEILKIDRSQNKVFEKLTEIETDIAVKKTKVNETEQTLDQINSLLKQAFSSDVTEKSVIENAQLLKSSYDLLSTKEVPEPSELMKYGQIQVSDGKFEHQKKMSAKIKALKEQISATQKQAMVILCKMENKASGRKAGWESMMQGLHFRPRV